MSVNRLLLLLLLVGCTDATGVAPRPDAELGDASAPGPCGGELCPVGTYCDQARCVPLGETAAACRRDTECESLRCAVGEYPDGFCVEACDAWRHCLPGFGCLADDFGYTCYPRCETSETCRAGYVCATAGRAAGHCVPPCEVLGCAYGDVCVEDRCGLDSAPRVVALGAPCGGALTCGPDQGCAGGRCRLKCDPETGCPGGERCAERIQGAQWLCGPGCDLHSQTGCAEGETCVFDGQEGRGAEASLKGRCQARTLPPGEGEALDACEPSDEVYFGTCEADALCQPLLSRGPTCIGLCDGFDRRTCPSETTCLPGLLRDSDLGVCLSDCAVFAPRCPEGQACLFYRVGPGARGQDEALGWCGVAGVKGEGEACEEAECAAGLLCVPLKRGEPARCLALCRADEDCALGRRCLTGVFGVDEQGQGGSTAVGVCL